MTEWLDLVVWTISIVILTIVAILVKIRIDASRRIEKELDLLSDLFNTLCESESKTKNDDGEQEDDLELDDELQSLIDDFNSLVDAEDGETDEDEDDEDRNARDT